MSDIHSDFIQSADALSARFAQDAHLTSTYNTLLAGLEDYERAHAAEEHRLEIILTYAEEGDQYVRAKRMLQEAIILREQSAQEGQRYVNIARQEMLRLLRLKEIGVVYPSFDLEREDGEKNIFKLPPEDKTDNVAYLILGLIEVKIHVVLARILHP